ncbi:MAG: hypothetical protein M3279_13290 [Actinomycetota bacterium]|nr:hypothetical protein [Actinomycetota bacterium]
MSLRYRLADESDFSTTELVGVLMAVDPGGHITVLDRRGNACDVAIDAIEALKVFPA